jgi:hypothetical protein
MTEQQQRECTLNPDWIKWWQEMLRVLDNMGHIVTDNRTVIYRVNQTEKIVTLVHGKPSHNIIDQRCIEACGYKCDVSMDQTAATICNIEARDPSTPILMRLAPGVYIFDKGTKKT